MAATPHHYPPRYPRPRHLHPAPSPSLPKIPPKPIPYRLSSFPYRSTHSSKPHQIQRRKKMEVRCMRCGDSGHYAVDCRKGGIHCFNCKKMGHRARDCPLFNRRDSMAVELHHNSELAAALSALHASAFLHLINPRSKPDAATVESALNIAWRRQGGWWVVKKVSDGVFHVQFPSDEDAARAISEGMFSFSGFNATFSPWSMDFGAKMKPQPCFTWINVPLLPYHMWNHSSVEQIVRPFGKLVTLSGDMKAAAMREQALVLIEVEDVSHIPKNVMIHYQVPWTKEIQIHEVPILIYGSPIPTADVASGKAKLFSDQQGSSTSFWRRKESPPTCKPDEPVNNPVQLQPHISEPNQGVIGDHKGKAKIKETVDTVQDLAARFQAPPNPSLFGKHFLNISGMADSSIKIPNVAPNAETDAVPHAVIPMVPNVEIPVVPAVQTTSQPIIVINSDSPKDNLHIPSEASQIQPPSSENSHDIAAEEQLCHLTWEGKPVCIPQSLFDHIKPALEQAIDAELGKQDSKSESIQPLAVGATSTFRTRSLIPRRQAAPSSTDSGPPGFDEGTSRRRKRIRSATRLPTTRPFLQHLRTSAKSASLRKASDSSDASKKKTKLMEELGRTGDSDLMKPAQGDTSGENAS